MSSPMKRSLTAIVVLTIAIDCASAAETAPDAKRLPDQQHNRMLYIKTDGKPDVYVDMPNHFDVGSPTISNDGKWIAFDADTVGDTPVRESWLVGIDGKGLRKVANGATPRWSPDGKRLVITRDADGNTDIGARAEMFEIDVASGKERRLCAGRFGDWSPDGKQLVYANGGEVTSNGGTHTDSKLYIAKADGSQPQELGEGDWPSWSPDGKKIACCLHEQDAPPMIWVIDLASKKSERLGAAFYRPQWAGDSQSVAAKGLVLTANLKGTDALPVRFWIDKSRVEFFLMTRDNPWSPCLSRDGKSVVVVVDSKEPRKRAGEGEE